MNKLMETIIEINTKGTLQEQAVKLCNEEKLYKKLIYTYNKQFRKTTDYELLHEINLMRYKYAVRLDSVRNEMCYLNKRIIDTLNVIEEYVDFDDFVKVFRLKEDETNRKESFYNNLMMSSTKIGHLVRTGLIQNEKMVKEMIEYAE